MLETLGILKLSTGYLVLKQFKVFFNRILKINNLLKLPDLKFVLICLILILFFKQIYHFITKFVIFLLYFKIKIH